MARYVSEHSVDLIVQALPPLHDAIGEYARCLAIALASKAPVRTLIPLRTPVSAIEQVKIVPCFHLNGFRRFDGLLEQLLHTSSCSVLLQYNPFCWGKRGWAPDLIRLLQELRRRRPDLVIGVMFHETYTMNPGWRAGLLRMFQQRQFRALCKLADVLFFSTEVWATTCRGAIRDRPVIHLPVGANLPPSIADRGAIRESFRIPGEAFVCGVFGGAHPSRMIGRIESAVRRIVERLGANQSVRFLHIGGEPISWDLGDVAVAATGRLPAQQASDAIATLDLMINPFSDGVSTRRGSVIASLQNGVPVLTTQGQHTDQLWLTERDNGVFLAPADCESAWLETTDRAIDGVTGSTAQLRCQANAFFQHNFTWERIAKTLLETLGDVRRSR